LVVKGASYQSNSCLRPNYLGYSTK